MTSYNKDKINEKIASMKTATTEYFKQLEQLPLKQLIVFSIAITGGGASVRPVFPPTQLPQLSS